MLWSKETTLVHSVILSLSLMTVSATSETEKSVSAGNHTEPPENIPYSQLISSEKAAMAVLGLSVAALAVLYLPALIYRVCCLLVGCQHSDFEAKTDDFTSLLGSARDIRVNKRSTFEGSILENLARGHAKYSKENL